MLTAHVTCLTGIVIADTAYCMVCSWNYVSLFTFITCGNVTMQNIQILSEEIPHLLISAIVQCKSGGAACCKCMAHHLLKIFRLCHKTCLHAAKHSIEVVIK
jgi:hypothetical protein